jgi:hypothetical protein
MKLHIWQAQRMALLSYKDLLIERTEQLMIEGVDTTRSVDEIVAASVGEGSVSGAEYNKLEEWRERGWLR